MPYLFFFIKILILIFNISLFAEEKISDNAANTQNVTIGNYVFKGPENLRAQVDGIQVKLIWDSVNLPGITYNIYRSTEEQGEYLKINKEEIKINEYIDNKKNSIMSLLSSIKYFYKVSAVDSGKEIGESNIVFAVPTGSLLPPDEVNVVPYPDKVLIKWVEPDSTGEYEIDGYNIFRSIDDKEEGIKLNKELIKGFEYEDKDIEQGVKYFYKLQSVDVRGNTSAFSKSYETMPFSLISEPLDVTAYAKSSESIKIAWSEPDIKGTYGIGYYNIFRSENPDSFPEKPINIKPVKTYYDEEGKVFYFDNIINSTEPPQPGKNYYYKVVPVDAEGHAGVASKVAGANIEILKLKKSGIISAEISEYGLPPDSNLKISGSKQIELSYKYVFETGKIPQRTRFDIKQPLKVKVEGNIGKKITVEVDHDDDRTQDEQRKISIKYQGDKEETIQEVNFGDITLSIPATRFVSYSQSLFGINAKAKFGDKFTLSAIAAQTKGITAKQTFKGNLREKEVNGKIGIFIMDTDFIKNTYYYITKENIQIKPGSVVVYVDNANAYDSNIYTRKSYPTGKFEFDFKYLGLDYTVDYKNNIIKFSFPIYDNYIIAIAYETMDGRKIGFDASGNFDFNEANLVSDTNGMTSEYAHLIQDGTMQNPKDISHKVLSYYYLGDTQIFDPKLDQDFEIRIYDMSDKEYYIPKPTDPDADKWYEIDTDFGLLRFKSYYPFVYPNNSPCDPATSNTRIGTEDDAYKTYPPVSSRYKIYLRYKYYVSSYKLDYPGVVYGSERVYLNGRLLKKDVDYYIIYETGEISFIDKNLIQSDSEIIITYEYFPFFQAFPSNLYGARAEYKLLDNLSLGSTFLYKSANTSSKTIPDARSTYQGLSTPYSMYILDGDIKFDLKKDQINKILDALPLIENSEVPVDFSFQAEIAHSNFNPNIFDKNNEHGVAMIDNIEGADNIISTSMDLNYWFPASRPQASDISTDRIQIRKSNITDVDPAPSSGTDIYGTSDRKIMLQLNYANLTSSRWDAYRYLISSYGENLNSYSYIEMWIYTTQPIEIGFDLGVISEDSNGNGILNTEDNSGGRPNGILESGEDIGIDQSGNEYWGGGNGFLDTEDMSNNGILDTYDAYYQYRKTLTETGRWINLKIDLKKIGEFVGYNVTTDPANKNFLSLVKHLRLVIRGTSATPVNGYVKISSVDITGNSWVLKVMPNSYDRVGNKIDSPDVNKFNMTTVNQYTDSSYIPNTSFFEYQSEEDKKSEKGLKINYELSNYDFRTDGKPIYFATKDLSRSIGYDYSAFKKLRFDILYSKKDGSSGSGKILFIRLGTGTSDDNNYYQYNTQLDEIPVDNAWHTIELRLDGSDKKRSEPVGSPNLKQINYISIGVINPNSMSVNEIFYINNIRLTDPDEKVGSGKYTNATINYSNFGTLSHSFEEKESDFMTIADIGSSIVKQHSRKNSINFNYNQISFLPVNNSYSKEELFTEGKYRNDPEYTSNYIIPDIVRESFTNSTTFSLVPNLTLINNLTKENSKNRYVKVYTYKDYDYEKLKTVPSARYIVPAEIELPAGFKVPLGNNTIEGNIAFTDERYNYIQPEPITICADCFDQWKLSREQSYKWTGNYKIDRLTLSPGYQYSLNEIKGNVQSIYTYYQDRISPDKKYVDDYILLKRSIIPALSLSLGEILIFNPQISYQTNYTMDYSQRNLSTTGNFSFMTKVELKKLLDFLPDISTYNISINIVENYNDAYYADSTKEYEKLSFETKWFINSWENIFNIKKIEELENISYNGSLRLNHNLNFSEIKLLDRISISPGFEYGIYRSSYSRILNTFTNTITLSVYNIQIFNVNIPGLEKFIRNETISGKYSYNNTKTINPTNKEEIIAENSNQQVSATLNFKDYDANENPLTGQIGITYSNKNNKNKEILTSENIFTPTFQINYQLKFGEPFVFPSWMPWIGGKAFKLEHILQWQNSMAVTITRGDEKGGTGANKQSNEKYTASTEFSYNFLENFNGIFRLTYENNVDRIKDPKYSYSSIEISLSFSAYF